MKILLATSLVVFLSVIAFSVTAQVEPVVVKPRVIGGTPPAAQSKPDYDEAVRCECQEQCEALWIEAANTIQSLTRMRLRTTTDFMLETFVDRIGISGTVVKRPVGKGVYEIDARISVPGSGDAAYSARRAFNVSMDIEKNKIQCPSPS